MQKKDLGSSFDTRVSIDYDVTVIYQSIKIIHVIDRRDLDYLDFGFSFLNQIAAWVLDADLNPEKILK